MRPILHVLLIPNAEHFDAVTAPHAPGAARRMHHRDLPWFFGTFVVGVTENVLCVEESGWRYATKPEAAITVGLVLARDGKVSYEGVGRACLLTPTFGGWFHAPFIEQVIGQLWEPNLGAEMAMSQADAIAGTVNILWDSFHPMGTIALIHDDGSTTMLDQPIPVADPAAIHVPEDAPC